MVMMFYMIVIMTVINFVILGCICQISKIWLDRYAVGISHVNKLVIQINKVTNKIEEMKNENSPNRSK